MKNLQAGIALTFFISGFASLTFQVVWRKALSQTVGVDFFSSTLIVTIFMLGLAIGAEIGKLCLRRLKRPIMGYLYAEVFVTFFGVFSVPSIYFMPNISLALGTGISTSGYVADFAANAVLLLLPTIAMGTSFPIVIHYFRRVFVPGAAVGFLYSANIFGAAAGALLSGVVLIGVLGLNGTAIAASLINLLQIAYIGYLVWTRKDADLSGEESNEFVSTTSNRDRSKTLTIAFTIGFVALAFEMIFVRMAIVYFSTNNYVFPIIVCCYLCLMAAGNQMSGQMLSRGINPHKLFNWMAAATVATILFSLALPSLLTTLGMGLETFKFSQPRYVTQGALGMVAGALAVSTLMMLPVAAISAMFPIFVHSITQNRDELGVNVGTVYFVQTIGNVLGAGAIGFFLLPLLGTVLTLQLAAIAVIACAIAFTYRRQVRQFPVYGGMIALAAIAFSLTPFSVYSNATFNGHTPTRFSEEVDGVALKYDQPNGTSINIGAERSTSFNSGSPFGSMLDDTVSVYDALTQNEVKRALIIGIGTGALAVQLQQRYPNAEIVIVELLDVVIREMRERGSEALKDVIAASPVYITDGRRYVERKALPEGEKFDLIQIGVFHVTSSGAGGLFTQEFQRDLRAILTPNGAITFNAYLPAVRTAFSIFDEGLIYSRELGRLATDAMFFNNDEIDIKAGMRRYPSVIAAHATTMPNTSNIQTSTPNWYFSPDDPRYFFVKSKALTSMLQNVALQTDDLPSTEFFLTQQTTWPGATNYSTTKLDPRHWEEVDGFALDGSFGSFDYAPLAVLTSSATQSTKPETQSLLDGQYPTSWSAASGPAWIGFEYTSHRPVISGYRISISPSEAGTAPTDWAFEGSDDGAIWNPLHTVTAFDKWSGENEEGGGRVYPNFARIFWFKNDRTFAHYRLSIDRTINGEGARIRTINLYENSIFGHASMVH